MFIYIGAGIIIILLLILLIIAIRCYFTRKEKENAKNGNMFSTEAPNVFSDVASEMDNDMEVSHISGSFYDPVHPDMILYRDADGTRNAIRAMRPLSTIYPCAGARMYGNVDYVPQEPGRFTRSRSKEEESVNPEVMTSPKSLGAYSTSQFYYN
ncbi:Uncharacterized protein OBRU01_25111 [Operophtera brumata]|uniref:Uncharacterized protein n=1 Tax=Operophtera brumata TaxID=104452 RepID=A0A0L7KGR7_OPEBR|nr:Uncharacterized protein OBRU01_25111 [Operophtera brumata]